MKTLVAGASFAALLLASSAMAQTSSSPAPSSPTPAERPSTSAPAAPSTTAPAARPNAAAPSNSNTSMAQNANGDWRASKLIGTAVYNQANERIGDVNEILLDNSGKISRVVLGVGGFLGMGEHEVAVPFSDLKIAQDGTTMKIMTSYTKQSLTSMPQWRWENSATSATGTPAKR